MKTVLCYGDSLTWGYNAEGPDRHALKDRWPSVVQSELGDVQVIAEGLNGRTTAFDDYLADADRNGARILPAVLVTHSPLDLVIIMLGSNDMKPFICGRAIGAKQGMERLVGIVRGTAYPLEAAAPQVLIVSPPPLSSTNNSEFDAMFDGGVAESRKLADLYAALADEVGSGFFDAGTVAATTPLDGVHLDAANTRAIGEALAPIVRLMLEL
jgi:lysophospholipase L1-like esterase